MNKRRICQIKAKPTGIVPRGVGLTDAEWSTLKKMAARKGRSASSQIAVLIKDKSMPSDRK